MSKAENKNKMFYNFNYSEDDMIVTKTGDVKGDVGMWFRVDTKHDRHKREVVQGDITEFIYDGRKGSMPTKIFEKNFTKVEVTSEG